MKCPSCHKPMDELCDRGHWCPRCGSLKWGDLYVPHLVGLTRETLQNQGDPAEFDYASRAAELERCVHPPLHAQGADHNGE